MAPTNNNFSKDRVIQMIDQGPAYKQYTPLKVLSDELFLTIRDRGLLYHSPSIAKVANKWDKSILYKFHDTYGHKIA